MLRWLRILLMIWRLRLWGLTRRCLMLLLLPWLRLVLLLQWLRLLLGWLLQWGAIHGGLIRRSRCRRLYGLLRKIKTRSWP